MAAIDIGSGAVTRTYSTGNGKTCVDLNNPANGTGKITSFEFWFHATPGDAEGVKAGTFSGAGTDYTSRDVETIGDVTAGSKQTFSGLDCSVTTGDFAGVYASGGAIAHINAGGLGYYHIVGDQFGTGEQTYTLDANSFISIYGTGATPGWSGKIAGVTNPAMIGGVDVANIQSVKGVVSA